MKRLQSVYPRAESIEQPTQDDLGTREFRYGWIDAHAAMAHLGVTSLTALYRLIHEHRLPYGRVGRHYRFRRADLDQWIAVRGVDALSGVRRVS